VDFAPHWGENLLELISACYCLVCFEDYFEIYLFTKYSHSNVKKEKKTLPFKKEEHKLLIDFVNITTENSVTHFVHQDVSYDVRKFRQDYSSVIQQANLCHNSLNTTVSKISKVCPMFEDRHVMLIFENGVACELSFQNFRLQISSAFKLVPQELPYKEIVSYQQFLFCSNTPALNCLCSMDVWDVVKQKIIGTIHIPSTDSQESLSQFKISANGLVLTAVGKDNSLLVADLDCHFELIKEVKPQHEEKEGEFLIVDEDDDTEDDEEEEEEDNDEEIPSPEKNTERNAIPSMESLVAKKYPSETFYQSHWFDDTEPQQKNQNILIDSFDDFSLEKDFESVSPFVIANKPRKEALLRDASQLRRGINRLDSESMLSRRESFLTKSIHESTTMEHSPRKEELMTHLGSGLLMIHPLELGLELQHYTLTNDKCYLMFHTSEPTDTARNLRHENVQSGRIGCEKWILPHATLSLRCPLGRCEQQYGRK